ncbi:helix-turn-helix domain-containing protein [Streptomyces anulatus]|uniref:helix-turn-helix domain-containing protein n=1 Tax=Streptomyces sp. NPDC088719 TaxID=3365872 RepID=UPI00382AA99E
MPDGFDWPEDPRKVSPEVQLLIEAEFRKRYDNGATIRGLMEESGRSFGYVRRRLVATGVTFRPRGGNMRPSPRSAGSGPRAPR